jgi:hypothetical protein
LRTKSKRFLYTEIHATGTRTNANIHPQIYFFFVDQEPDTCTITGFQVPELKLSNLMGHITSADKRDKSKPPPEILSIFQLRSQIIGVPVTALKITAQDSASSQCRQLLKRRHTIRTTILLGNL